MPQLPFDCLNEIFEYLDALEDDKVTLRSCLLVNRLWCEVSVRILWKSIRNYNTLIACLSNDSKEILSKNGIITATSASRPPMFNYASFCKVLSIYKVNNKIKELLNNQYPQNSSDNLSIITREIFKFLMNQISSLRELYLCYSPNIHFTSFPGTKDCLKGLTELICDSNIHPEFFYHLSQMCCNIQLLVIFFEEVTSDGLADLISVQQNLKVLNLMQTHGCESLTADIIILLTNLPDSLIELDLCGGEFYIPLSFIAKLTNLQEMTLTFNNQIYLEDFKELQYATFSHLQVLKFKFDCPRDELLIKFLENNGKNLKELYYVYGDTNSLNLSIAKFCPNLRKLFTGFKNNEVETLKMILNSCQYLESFKVWCCDDYLNEKELFEVFIKYSPKNFYELKLCYFSFDEEFVVKSELLPEELESFFISWSDRIPQKSLSLMIIRNFSNRTLDEVDGNMEIIEKYIKSGIIKKFRTIKCFSEDFE